MEIQNLKVLTPQGTVYQDLGIPSAVENIIYSDAGKIWAHAEKKDFCALLISMSFIAQGNQSLISAIRAVHENMVICLIQDMEDISILIDVVNQSGHIRICREADLRTGLHSAIADAIMMSMEIDKKDKLIEALQLENEQYEFMLRHSLLS